MAAENSFTNLVKRVRFGDQDAAAELVREFEPAIRRALKIQLRDPRLRRVFDSMDVCQSVLGNFFVRAALGQFELDKPEDLLKLLATRARNNLATRARQPHVTRRDYRGLDSGSKGSHPLQAHDASPSHLAVGRDLLEAVRGRLSDDERLLADQRASGREWSQIAASSGSSPEALRKKLARAVDRVTKELGLEEIATA